MMCPNCGSERIASTPFGDFCIICHHEIISDRQDENLRRLMDVLEMRMEEQGWDELMELWANGEQISPDPNF